MHITTTQELAARGHAHTTLRNELDRQGPLHRHERELLLEAADALLFDEPEGWWRRAEAMALLDALECNERRTAAEAARLRIALDGCGETELVAA
jgi:ABC-type uncharacterized transport system YnjBCD ATPase subunit